MIKIYHNPRCSKSREGLEKIKNSGEEFEVREYLKEQVSREELQDLLEKLSMVPIQIIRINEKIWKENYKGRDLSDDELIEIMTEHPKLIQRPIVVKGQKAVIGRPVSAIDPLIK